MKFFVILFAIFAIGTKYRSVSLPIVEDIDDELSMNKPVLEKLISIYDNFANFIYSARKLRENKQDIEQQIEFLKYFHMFIERFLKERLNIKNMYIKLDNDTNLQKLNNNATIRIEDSVNYEKTVLKDILNKYGEFLERNLEKNLERNLLKDIFNEHGEFVEHIRIKRTTEEQFNNEVNNKTVALEERILIDIQYQMMQFLKYLDQLCKKYYPISMPNLKPNCNNISHAEQSKNVTSM